MQTKHTPKIVPMEVDDKKTLPMTVDESHVIPMTVTENLTEEDFLPTEEAVNKNLPDGYAEKLESLQSVKPPVVLVKDQVIEFGDKTCRVVEVVDVDRFHLKNINQPFDSFIVTSSELE